MNFIKDKAVLNITKFSIFILLTLIGIFLMPQYANTVRDANYLRNLKDEKEQSDFNGYLEELSSYYEFYYDKDPIINRDIIDDGDLYLEYSVYAVSYYQTNNIGDSLQFFIHDIKYKDQQIDELHVHLLYEDVIVSDSLNTKDDVYYLNLNPINKNALVKSFFATDFTKTSSDNSLNYFKSIELYTLDNDKQKTPIPLMAFTDNEEDLKDIFPIYRPIKDNNLVRERYNISANIKDKDLNIPTNQELELNNYFYKEFDYNVLKPFNTIYTLIFILYILFYFIILYFLYVHKLIKLHFKSRNV